jgi:hypothetical protein
MPYTKKVDRCLMQEVEADNLTLTMIRIEESEHGFKHCRFYRTELIEGEKSIFVSNDSNVARAFYIFETIKKGVTS